MERITAIRERLAREPCVIDCHTHVGVDADAYAARAYPYALGFEDLVVRMDRLGVAASAVFPFPNTAYFDTGGGALVEAPSERCRFPYELENRHLFEELCSVFGEHSGRALPFVMVDPARKVNEQVALIRELHERHGVFGIKACTSFIQSRVSELLSGGRAILDLAREWNLPVMLHCAYDPKDPWAQVGDVVAVARAADPVRVCIAHTARFHKASLDQAASMPNCFVDTSAFTIHCELARRDDPAVPAAKDRFPADYPDPHAAFRAIAAAYPETLVWGSDQPFDSFVRECRDEAGACTRYDLRASFGAERRLLDAVPQPTRHALAWRNAMRFLFGD